jgi:hypothetical protein
MFDWELFACLVAVSMPGILVTVPASLNTILQVAETRLPVDAELPPKPVLILVSTLQSVVLIAAGAAVGTAVAARVGLRAPFFEALVAGDPLGGVLRPQLLPALLLGLGGAVLFVAAYYLVIRPRLDHPTVLAMETLRHNLGIAGRLLYGGIAEEVLTRWGLMSLLAWVGVLLFGAATPAAVWAAIVVSGILFGLGHLPGYLAAGCRKTPLFVGAMIALNLWASLLFGWLFWQVGLLAAMLGHMLFHLVWWPFDLYHLRRTLAA